MKTGQFENWWSRTRRWISVPPSKEPRVGIALGGGFARGISHVGVLRVFEQEHIPIHCISGVSAGSIVAAAFASGCSTDEIEQAARGMRLSDLARWTISTRGLMETGRMNKFLRGLLKKFEFEHMRIPLAVVATNLTTAAPIVFRGRGDVLLPIRASCAYPALFPPVPYMNHWLADGLITMEVPARPLRHMGATHVVSVSLPAPPESADVQNMMGVVRRCFQIMAKGSASQWRGHSNLVLAPQVQNSQWDCFHQASDLIAAGELAARAMLPQILKWFTRPEPEPEPGSVRVAPLCPAPGHTPLVAIRTGGS